MLSYSIAICFDDGSTEITEFVLLTDEQRDSASGGYPSCILGIGWINGGGLAGGMELVSADR
jgi:hypothetical protein